MELPLNSLVVVHTHSPKKKTTNFLISALTTTSAVFIVFLLFFHKADAFNDEKGILKWSPYPQWFSNNFRYSAPSSFYVSPNWVGTPYKRFTDAFSGSSGTSGGASSGVGIYKWSPVYFSGGSGSASALHSPSSYIGNSGTGYMYSASRPRWSSSDYGSSRFLTRYYGGNSFVPGPRSPSVIDLGGSNDLSALLGEEVGLGLENDTVDVLDGDHDTSKLAQKANKK